MASDIPIVDDEADIRELVSGILEDEGLQDEARQGQRRGSARHRGAPAVFGHP